MGNGIITLALHKIGPSIQQKEQSMMSLLEMAEFYQFMNTTRRIPYKKLTVAIYPNRFVRNRG